MYGLIKIANEQNEHSALSTAGNAALAAGGAGAIAASHDRLLGRQKLYHSTTDDQVDHIRNYGFDFNTRPMNGPVVHTSKRKSMNQAKVNPEFDSVVLSNEENARRLGEMQDMLKDESKQMTQSLRDRLKEQYPDMSKSDLRLKLSRSDGYDVAMDMHDNAERLFDYEQQYHRAALDRRSKLLDDPALTDARVKTLTFNVPYSEDFTDKSKSAFKYIDPINVVGSPKDIGYTARLKESLRSLPDYLRKHPNRFGEGAALVGLGSIGIGQAAKNQFGSEE